MRTRVTRTSWTAAFAALSLLGATRPASASSFTVNPTQIFLAPRTTSALLTVRNESDDTLRFQLTVFKWDQTPQGELKLEPTQDVVFFPALLSLAPKEERRIRVGAATPFAASEKTYRIFVEELPPQGVATTNAVRVLTKMGVPIFLQPARVQAQAALNDLTVKNGVFTFAVRNTGNVHFVPQTVRVQGTNAAGQVVVDKQVEGWYILSGGVRAYELPLPAPECRTVTALAVTVQVGSTSLKERLETPVACSP